MVKKINIDIIGGSGYIGTSLTNSLCKKYFIKIIDQKKPIFELNSNCSYVPCDIADIEQIEQALKNVDFVLHTAIIQIPLINE